MVIFHSYVSLPEGKDIYKVVPPKLCLLVYNPINYRYITNKNHIVIGVINQLSYLGGTTL